MDLREKLIELISKFCSGLTVADITPPYGYENLADHLIANGVTAQEWIPVSEPPKDDPTSDAYQSVSIALKTGKVVSGFYRHDTKEWWGDVADGEYGIVTDLVTHWMPLPEHPKGE